MIVHSDLASMTAEEGNEMQGLSRGVRRICVRKLSGEAVLETTLGPGATVFDVRGIIERSSLRDHHWERQVQLAWRDEVLHDSVSMATLAKLALWLSPLSA